MTIVEEEEARRFAIDILAYLMHLESHRFGLHGGQGAEMVTLHPWHQDPLQLFLCPVSLLLLPLLARQILEEENENRIRKKEREQQ